jgi:Site-specific DNA methylase
VKILNLYSGIGGNRALWGSEHDITAVEVNTQIAQIYHDRFPHDKVICEDAHKYLLEHYKEYDFIWSSPPCQSHSKIRFHVGVGVKRFKNIYPDMSLYQEIILLQNNNPCLWVVENVNPYYEPLVKPNAHLQRHLFWANFTIPYVYFQQENLRDKNKVSQMEALHSVDLSAYKISNKRQILRNCTPVDVGAYVLNCAIESLEDTQGLQFREDSE